MLQLPALAREVVGIEHNETRLGHDVLAQHHPRLGFAVASAGGEHHGVRVRLLACSPGLGEPAGDDLERLGGQGIGEEFAVLGHGGQC